MIKLVVLDLDGTIADTSEGILNSHRYAHKMMNRAVPSDETLYGLIGGELLKSYISILHFSKEEAITAVRHYRQYYQEKGIYQAKLYDNIPFLLQKLKKKGYKVAIATLKAEKFAKKMMENFGVAKNIDYICGMNESDTLSKEELIKKCMKFAGVVEKETVMIGDTNQDHIGANKSNVYFIGVGYGFGLSNLENEDEYCPTPMSIYDRVVLLSSK